MSKNSNQLPADVEQLQRIILDIHSSRSYKLAAKLAAFYKDVQRFLPSFLRKTNHQTPKIDTQNDLAAEPLQDIPIGKDDICIVSPAFFNKTGSKVVLGGAERYLYELYLLIKDMGYKVHVFQCANDEDWTREYCGMTVHGLACGNKPERFNRRFHRLVPKCLATIYHVNFLAGPVCHENSIGISHGVYWDNLLWQDNAGLKATALNDLLQYSKNLKKIVSVDTNTVNWMRATRWDLAAKYHYIPNFVDLDQFRPRPAGQKPKRFRILYPRRLYAARGYHLMAEVIPRLLEANLPVEFAFVGQVEADWQESLQQLLQRFPNHVKWYELSPEDMYKAYADADLTVIPTVNSEGTSLSCLEAQASGNCVIATNVGGLTDLVIDGYNGLLIEPTASALEKAIIRVIKDHELRNYLVGNALEIIPLFSRDQWRKRWQDFLKDFLATEVTSSTRSAVAA